jgi:hypothetical protein
MYSWIWRHLPFGVWGKLTGSLLLAGAGLAMLWFVVFPWMDPWLEETLLPWNESQLEGDFAPPDADTVDPNNPDGPAEDDPGVGTDEELVGPDGEVLDDEHDLPYETDD